MRYRALIIAFLAICVGFLTACSDAPSAATGPLTYEQIRGTGLANTCPQLGETSRGSIPIDPSKTYTIKGLCLEPTSYFIKEEPTNKRQVASFVPAKALTRYTSSIDQVMGTLKANAKGGLTFVEEDGFDFQATTVQLPGGERVPFLFTIKNLVATTQSADSINTSTDFEGDFKVPSYRTSNFLDPKGRGLTTGYDNAVALPAQADSEELERENFKTFDIGQGKISLQVAKVDNTTGEIAGTFESVQPSDTDMGGKEPVDVKIRGIFYARVEPA
ncbi:photosystem II manganese-stabilizing polypeptide [Oscillatoria sp. FACHB-1407]|uniref:photosystem II manganese-stabilizing polypeptide n=1 Tax=Oscillatoria sp. FACHB-1407 TaxID=2692847 RepID=UPI001689FB59|nr:photosystem II manganese-stabilizing polypeptide [Oscillatoria sp. FACHB-1407]MBD2459600.1 photosystem II manganese-stabilizing polypeptide [Oscillatoria sp. FACHB-1407]